MDRYKLKLEKYQSRTSSNIFLTTAEEKVAMDWATQHIEQSTERGYWTLFVWLEERQIWFDIMCDSN